MSFIKLGLSKVFLFQKMTCTDVTRNASGPNDVLCVLTQRDSTYHVIRDPLGAREEEREIAGLMELGTAKLLRGGSQIK